MASKVRRFSRRYSFRRPPIFWSDAMTHDLRKMWSKNTSAIIAAELSVKYDREFSVSSVVGRARYIELPHKSQLGRPRTRPAKPAKMVRRQRRTARAR